MWEDLGQASARPLIAAHQLGLSQHVPLDRLEQFRLVLARRQGELRVQGVEFEEVAVGRTPGRARSAIADLPEVVHSVASEARNRVPGRYAFGELAPRGPDPPYTPVDPPPRR